MYLIFILATVALIVIALIAVAIPLALKKKGRQERSAKVLGIVSFAVHLALIAFVILCVIYDAIPFNSQTGSSSSWISYIILFAFSVFSFVGFILALRSDKSRGCAIALLVMGILSLCVFDIVGILNVVGAACTLNARKNVSAPTKESDLGVLVKGNSANYYYPDNGCDLYEQIKNFGNTGVFSVRFDDCSAPVKIRAFLTYGNTEEETYVFCELAFHYEVPLENRCISLKIVRDESGRTAFRTVGAVTDDVTREKIGKDITAILSDKGDGDFITGELRDGVGYGVDLRMNAIERQSFAKAGAQTAGAQTAGSQTAGGQTQNRSGARYDGKPLPVRSERWFIEKGIRPVKTPIRKRDIRKLSIEEREMVCFTTFPYVFKSLVFISAALGAVLVAAIVALLIGVAAGGLAKGGIFLAVVLMVSLFGGSFIVNPWSRILDGFSELSGTQVLRLPIGYKIWIFFATGVALLWGYFSTMIFMLIGRDNEAKARSFPLVVVPEGCGFDEMVEFYAAYEEECAARDYKNAKLDEAQRKYREGVEIYERGVEEIEKNPAKNYIEKAEEKRELDKEKQKLDEKYEEVKKKYE